MEKENNKNSFKKFIGELNGSRAEGEIIKTFLISLITSLALIGILYFLRFQYTDGFLDKYGFFLFFSALSYALIMPAVSQVRTYKTFSCMSGMMVGMTIGMIAGFLPGFFIGATNGMFYGSILGMGIGIFFGAMNGKCCGIMGIMEGIMAGFMGGLMGAMTSVMMINDNLKLAGIFVFGISAVIISGLNYMIYKEMEERDREIDEDLLFVGAMSFILMIITVWLMVYGPRSLLFQ